MDSELTRFEAELERLSPGSLPEGLISRMEAAMEGWEEAPEEEAEEVAKVVPFPGGEEPEGELSKRRGGGIWAAAAGVALLGAAAALLMTANPNSGRPMRPAAVIPSPSVRTVEFSPQTAKRTILDASDGDVITAKDGRLLRVVRFNYVDRVVFRNTVTGEEVHLEVPAVNYRLIPVATD